jgi:CRISPR-associated protein Cst2
MCHIAAHEQFVETLAAFRDLRLGGTATKMDCRAVLGLTRLLIQKAETYRRPSQWIRSMWVTHYKDMGQAHTLMGIEQLALPDWFGLRTSREAQWWLQTIEEHDTVVRRLNDSHSDEFALLKQYRRTFQTRRHESITEFVEFLAAYGILLFKKRAQDHWLLPQFTVRGITPIIRHRPDLQIMVRNPGFLAVAAAIRSATVGAQAARSRGKLNHREIRYGPLTDIHRAGLAGQRELWARVSPFIEGFNRETDRRRAMGIPSTHIQDGEMEAFADLLDRLPSSATAGSLLCGLAACVRRAGPTRTGRGDLGMIQSLSLCAEVTLALHNLNSEGREGNQQQTRMVHVIDAAGTRSCVNAVSGDMFKHIYVRHLTAILRSQGEPLSTGAAAGSPDRITVDLGFKNAIKGLNALEVQTEMLTRCAVTDVAGTLFTEGITVPRKSCAEFGWVVGIPDKVHTEQHFHVKFEPERRKIASQVPRGEGTIAGSQTVFHRPTNSGVYALVCHLELSRIGVNDVTREVVISKDARMSRQRAAVQALLATLLKPAGAQTNTQSPHILDCSGVLTTSSSYLPAPMLSPLSEGYRQEVSSIAGTLNRLTPKAVHAHLFDGLAEGVALLERVSTEL